MRKKNETAIMKIRDRVKQLSETGKKGKENYIKFIICCYENVHLYCAEHTITKIVPGIMFIAQHFVISQYVNRLHLNHT